MVYTILMKEDSKLYVSLFQIPEEVRANLAERASLISASGSKTSINKLILQALTEYFNLSPEASLRPKLPELPLRTFTVRMTVAMKEKLAITSAEWQIRVGLPV